MLPQHLIRRNRDRIGKIETAQRFAHRDPHAAFRMCFQQRIIESGVLSAEKEECLLGIGDIRIERTGFCGEIEIRILLRCRRMLRKEVIEIVIMENIELIPVIESCAFELCIVDAEAQRMNQMQ